MYSPEINNGKFKDDVHVLHRKEGVDLPPVNPLDMSPQERSLYYDQSDADVVPMDDVLRMTENVLKRANQQVVTKKTSTPRGSE